MTLAGHASIDGLAVTGAAEGTLAKVTLAVQDGFINVNARGAVTVGNVFDPAAVLMNSGVLTSISLLPGADSLANGADPVAAPGHLPDR